MMSEASFSSKSRSSHPLHIIKTLGEGTHGKVVLAVDVISGQQVAIKTIKKKLLKTDKEQKHVRQEIDITSQLHHPHIISVFEVFETETDVVLVLEYASGGELFDYINAYSAIDGPDCDTLLGGLSDAEARKIFRQLVSAVRYLHEKQIVHRDLKLENVLLDSENNAKLADFGLSAVFSNGQLLKTYCGSPLYASPEIVNGRPYHGPEVDCWSLGVLLYAMVYGIMPFDGRDFKTLRKQITLGLVQQPAVLSSAHDLILSILNPDQLCRATLSDIAAHRWLQSDTRSACHSTSHAYPSSVEVLSQSCHKHSHVDGHSYFPHTDSHTDSRLKYSDINKESRVDGCLQYSIDRYMDDNCSPKCEGDMLQWQYYGNSLDSREYVSCGPCPYTNSSVFRHETCLDESNARATGLHTHSRDTEYREDICAVDSHLVTSFIGTDVIAHDSSDDVNDSGCEGKRLSFSDSIARHSPCSSFDCNPLKTFSADSLDVGEKACGIDESVDCCGGSVSDADYNDVSGDDVCLRCYDFADIDAVLDSIADAEKIHLKDGLQLSHDSLE